MGLTNVIDSNSRPLDIQDPLYWVFCFLSFMTAKVDHKETRDLIAYAQIVVYLARKHGGKGLITYNRLFRQQVAIASD